MFSSQPQTSSSDQSQTLPANPLPSVARLRQSITDIIQQKLNKELAHKNFLSTLHAGDSIDIVFEATVQATAYYAPPRTRDTHFTVQADNVKVEEYYLEGKRGRIGQLLWRKRADSISSAVQIDAFIEEIVAEASIIPHHKPHILDAVIAIKCLSRLSCRSGKKHIILSDPLMQQSLLFNAGSLILPAPVAFPSRRQLHADINTKILLGLQKVLSLNLDPNTLRVGDTIDVIFVVSVWIASFYSLKSKSPRTWREDFTLEAKDVEIDELYLRGKWEKIAKLLWAARKNPRLSALMISEFLNKVAAEAETISYHQDYEFDAPVTIINLTRFCHANQEKEILILSNPSRMPSNQVIMKPVTSTTTQMTRLLLPSSSAIYSAPSQSVIFKPKPYRLNPNMSTTSINSLVMTRRKRSSENTVNTPLGFQPSGTLFKRFKAQPVPDSEATLSVNFVPSLKPS
jgi:hypothetical protein